MKNCKNLFYATLEEKYKALNMSEHIGKYDHLMEKVICKTSQKKIHFENNNADLVEVLNIKKIWLEKNYKDSYFIIHEWKENGITGCLIHENHLHIYFPVEARNIKIDQIIDD